MRVFILRHTVDNNSCGFDDIFKACGYTRKSGTSKRDKTAYDGNFQDNTKWHMNHGSEEGENETSGSAQGNKSSGFDFNCNDIPFGFQGMYPQLFVIIGEIIGNAVAGRIPLNVQDAFGNWLQLVGQIILTYNAQQQYFQSGPGRYFSPIFFNVSNPFCPYDEFENNENAKEGSCNKEKKRHKKSKVTQKDISKLDNNINELVKEINSLKCELNSINERIKQE